MRNAFLLPALASLCCVQAQQIDGYRYWFDDDAAGTITTAVAATDELVLTTAWPTPGLASGYHRVSVQVRDTNGEWSVPQTRHFTRTAQPITGYRYWVNDDPATLASGAIGPNDEVQLNSLIDPGSLTKDHNLITIQFMDADGEYSVPQSVWFVRGTGEVNGYQYWLDDDISTATTGSIGPNTVVDLIEDLALSTSPGQHLFTIRFSATNGTWSVPHSALFDFYLGLEELPGLSDLVLFPNPLTDELGLRLSTTEASRLDLEIRDVQGQLVRQLPTWAVAGNTYRNWDISDLAPGTYLLHISDDEGKRDMPFIKR